MNIIKLRKIKIGNSGFSLVELIIVIAIMAILIAVLAPMFIRYVERSRMSTDLNAVGSMLRALQAAAADETIGDPVDELELVWFPDGTAKVNGYGAGEGDPYYESMDPTINFPVSRSSTTASNAEITILLNTGSGEVTVTAIGLIGSPQNQAYFTDILSTIH